MSSQGSRSELISQIFPDGRNDDFLFPAGIFANQPPSAQQKFRNTISPALHHIRLSRLHSKQAEIAADGFLFFRPKL